MSNQSINFKINQVRLTHDMKNLYYSDICKELDQSHNDFILYANYITNDYGMGVYTNNHLLFQPNIIEGRNFSDEDFIKQTSTVLISKEYEKFCFKEGGKKYFIFDGVNFEVIGVYKRTTYEPEYYINFGAKQLKNNILSGDYYLDIKNNSKSENIKYINQLIYNTSEDMDVQNYNMEINQYYNSENKFFYYIQYIVRIWYSTIVCFIPSILVLINISIIFDLWLKQRTNEIVSRYKVYLNKVDLKYLILKDNLILASFAYIVSVVLILILGRYYLTTIFELSLNLKLFICFSMLYATFTTFMCIKLYRTNIKQFLDKVGGEWY